jgi:hypothetical protein
MKRIYDSNGQPVDDYRTGDALWKAGQNEIHTWYAYTDGFGRLWQVIQNRFENTGAWFAYVMPQKKAHRVLNISTHGFDGDTHGALWHLGQQNPLKLMEGAATWFMDRGLPNEVRSDACQLCTPVLADAPEASPRARIDDMSREELIEALEMIAMAGSYVVDSWEGGNLANAVTELGGALEQYGVFFPMDDEEEEEEVDAGS